MEKVVNYSDIVRKYIAELHQRDPNYFSTKTSFERNQDFKIFCQNNKDGLNFKNHRALYSQLLSRQKDTLNLLTTTKSTKAKTEKFTVTKGIQKANVSVNPTQQGQPEIQTNPQQTTGALPTVGARPVMSAQPQQSVIDTKTGLPIPQQQLMHPVGCQCEQCKFTRGEMIPMEPEEAGGILEILIDFWHSRNPDVEPMTPEEVVRVGKRLAPIMQRHMSGDVLLYGMGGIAIAQILMKRVDQARKNKPDKISDKQKKANQITAMEKENIAESLEKVEEIAETQKPENRKFFSKKKIREIEKLGDAEE
jgi:hypothetical protein